MGFLANIGRASPAIQSTMTEMEERPRRALRWGWEQEQAGQQKEISGQQKALNEMNINKMKAEEETRKEEERLDKAPVSLRTHPFFANFTPEDTEKIIGTGKKLGIVTGEKGNEETTGRGWKYFQRMARENEDAAVWMSNAKERKLRIQADDAYNQFLKVTDDPNATPNKKKKALDTLNSANAQWKGHKEGFEKFINAKRFGDDFKITMESPEFKAMPADRQNQIVMAGKSAIATGDYDQYYKARDKAFEEAKAVTPSWKIVQDKKSDTGYSYQDMNNPNAPLRIGAPVPSSAIEKEKTANIHYETDEKGNTVKIVSHPTTGQTINKENMGKIGKVTEKGQELKIPKLNVVRDLLDESYANMLGADKKDIQKRLSPEQMAAYKRILIMAEKNVETMEPNIALDKALTDWHKKNPVQAKNNYGLRADGTQKGPGFLGELKTPSGKVSTEISIGVNIGGKETEIPTLVPTLTKNEIDYLVKGGKPTKEIVDKAVDHAKSRISQGKSPFAQEGEQKMKPLTEDKAKEFLKSAGGNKDKARKLAIQAGYTF